MEISKEKEGTGFIDMAGVEIQEKSLVSNGQIIFRVDWSKEYRNWILFPIKLVNQIDRGRIDYLFTPQELNNGKKVRSDLRVLTD